VRPTGGLGRGKDMANIIEQQEQLLLSAANKQQGSESSGPAPLREKDPPIDSSDDGLPVGSSEDEKLVLCFVYYLFFPIFGPVYTTSLDFRSGFSWVDVSWETKNK